MIEKGSTWIKHMGRFQVDGYFKLHEQGTAFTGLTPTADTLHVYAKDSSGVTELFYRNSAGTERNLSGGLTGSGTANRLAYWTAAQVLGAVGALTQHRVLVADANGLPTNGNALLAGSVLFGGTDGIPEDDAALFWNNIQKTLLVGSSTAKSTSSTLEVTATSAGDPRGVTLQQFSADAAGFQLNLVKGRGTLATPAALVAADGTGSIIFKGYGSSTVLLGGARINAVAAENFTTGACGTVLAFAATPSGGILLAEKMRLLGDGDLVIGHTSAPFTALAGRGLSVVRSGTIAENCTYTFGVAGTSSQNRLVTARGVPGTPTATQSGDTVAWSLVGYGATAFTGGRARIEAAATQNWTDAAQGAQLAFLTTPNGSVTSAERLRINASGRVGIGIATEPSGLLHLQTADSTFSVLYIESTDGGSGPLVATYHKSASPAANDDVLLYNIFANDSGGTQRQTHGWFNRFTDPTLTTMDSTMIWAVMDNVNASGVNTFASLSSLGVWTDASMAKDKFFEGKPFDLWPDFWTRLKQLRIERYRSSRIPPQKIANAERHISPTAEDFQALFGLGSTPTPNPMTGEVMLGIAPKDLASLALVAIQDLVVRVEQLELRGA